LYYVRRLDFFETPDYDYLRQLFTSVLTNSGTECDWEFDWIDRQLVRLQWRNKVAVGPHASIPKGPLLPQHNFKKNSVGQILGPPQLWARVHCTPCTPYCYATVRLFSVSLIVASGYFQLGLQILELLIT